MLSPYRPISFFDICHTSLRGSEEAACLLVELDEAVKHSVEGILAAADLNGNLHVITAIPGDRHQGTKSRIVCESFPTGKGRFTGVLVTQPLDFSDLHPIPILVASV
jgi:hypothetical protein